MSKQIFKENFAKNFLVTVLLLFCYAPLSDFLRTVSVVHYDSILLVANLMIMAFLFSDFAFTYSATNIKNIYQRLLAHAITAIIIFGTGLLLEVSIITLNLKIQQPFVFIELAAILFYISLIFYDFWDIERK